LPLFQWQQVLDVLIVAVIIYYLLYFVRGTKTFIVLLVIALLGAVYYICSVLQLLTLVWVLEKVLLVGPIALIIIFTPEIRHFLERAAQTRLFIRPFFEDEPSKGTEDLLEEVVGALGVMSEKRIGGLIAFIQNPSALDDMVLGQRLDALTSAGLILSIFDTSAPLHDGAIVIDGDIISYAGCFFPLSEREQTIRQLGSRHHAAIGITERAEVVVLVVSEETGAMSVCHNGRIAYNLTGEQVLALTRLLLKPDPSRSSVMPRLVLD
jgi:diadenylate cyclase